MSKTKVHLASDNWAPAHPSIIETVVKANLSIASAYGSQRTIQFFFKFDNFFESSIGVY